MADNLQLNATTSVGDKITTQEMADGSHCQLVKLLSGTDDSTQVVPAGATGTMAAGALLVTIASDSDGQVTLTGSPEVSLGAATVAAGDLAKAQNAASASGDVGIACLYRRTATPADQSNADGDYEVPQMDEGRIYTWSAGKIADDAAIGTPQPVNVGGWAVETDGTDPSAVAEGDVAQLRTDLNRRLLVNAAHPNAFKATANGGTATTTVLKAAGGSGVHIYVTDLIFSAGGAQDFKLQEDTAGTPLDVVELVYLSANSTWSHQFATPLRMSDNVNLGVVTGQAQNWSCTVSGYLGP